MRRSDPVWCAMMLLGWLLVGESATAWWQARTWAPRGRAARVARRESSLIAPQGVLPAFSARGGIGTTPFLGNTRGLGAYSTNFGFTRRGAARWVRRGRWR
jgi:hypothetical protein